MDGSLGQYLSNTGATFQTFSSQLPPDQSVLVNLNGWNGESNIRFNELANWVERGGIALYLNLPQMTHLKMVTRGSHMSRHLEKDTILPFSLSLYTGKGLWTPCSPEYPKDPIYKLTIHPFYDGLPSNCLMGQEYRNVVSQWSIVEPKSNWIGGNITYDWYAGLKHKQNYIGVTEAFHGADLTQISYGKGIYILCTHRIVENLGKDPVADRLLKNMLVDFPRLHRVNSSKQPS